MSLAKLPEGRSELVAVWQRIGDVPQEGLPKSTHTEEPGPTRVPTIYPTEERPSGEARR